MADIYLIMSGSIGHDQNAETWLLEQGFTVYNPWHRAKKSWEDFGDQVVADVDEFLKSGSVFVCDKAEETVRGKIEIELAEKLGKDILRKKGECIHYGRWN